MKGSTSSPYSTRPVFDRAFFSAIARPPQAQPHLKLCGSRYRFDFSIFPYPRLSQVFSSFFFFSCNSAPLSHSMADAPPQSSGPEDTLASVQRALALLHQLQSSVSGFQLPSQLVLLERLNGLVTELGNMHSAAQDCHIQIPIEVLNFIDEGRNPDEFTKQLLNGCVQQNQATKGKVDSFKVLRKHLLEQVEEVFPVETEAFREIRSQSSVESRRASHAGNALSNGDVKLKIEH